MNSNSDSRFGKLDSKLNQLADKVVETSKASCQSWTRFDQPVRKITVDGREVMLVG